MNNNISPGKVLHMNRSWDIRAGRIQDIKGDIRAVKVQDMNSDTRPDRVRNSLSRSS